MTDRPLPLWIETLQRNLGLEGLPRDKAEDFLRRRYAGEVGIEKFIKAYLESVYGKEPPDVD